MYWLNARQMIITTWWPFLLPACLPSTCGQKLRTVKYSRFTQDKIQLMKVLNRTSGPVCSSLCTVAAAPALVGHPFKKTWKAQLFVKHLHDIYQGVWNAKVLQGWSWQSFVLWGELQLRAIHHCKRLLCALTFYMLWREQTGLLLPVIHLLLFFIGILQRNGGAGALFECQQLR